ncbi:hypothetical protein J2X31_003504 [Flavobacterium arsenatis]|uniref:Gliding motility-associated protein GldM C-terminal domain-containing protein n=1 Tax=Flavobacterium arsenatis TaxID=1484332 RepID=A0ABU1TUC3_9FLAO|nr:GldM family protein [Flavobacterium arsenatis]MDR6969473.1 hypothetical protein [Flavobacterium arsenatis]
MKNYISFLIVLFFTFSAFAQKDTIVTSKRSVIALDKVKVIYRGIINPISIAVSNCKSFIVSGLGVNKDEKGNFSIVPGSGLETRITVKIINNDDSVSIENHIFKIDNLPKLTTSLNGNSCIDCILLYKKEDLKDAIVSVDFRNFNFSLNKEVKEFKVKIPGRKVITVVGNKINDDVLSKLKKNKLIVISDIKLNLQGLENAYISINPLVFKVY